MELENKTALLGIGIGFFSAVAGVAMPLTFDVPPLAWRAVFCIGVLIFTVLVGYLLHEHFVQDQLKIWPRRLRKSALVCGVSIACVLAIWVAVAMPQPKNYGELILATLNGKADAYRKASTDPPTLEQLYIEDFKSTMRLGNEVTIQSGTNPNAHFTVRTSVLMDMVSHSSAMAFYLKGNDPDTAIKCEILAGQTKGIIDFLEKGVKIGAGEFNQKSPKDMEWPFSGTVYIYHEDELSPQEISKITDNFLKNDLRVVLRGREYAVMSWISRERDAARPSN